MAGKRSKRRRAEEARKERLRKRKRLLILLLSIAVLLALAVALPITISRQARLGRVNVLINGGSEEPYGVLSEPLRSVAGESNESISGTVELYLTPEALPPEERDVLMGPGTYGAPRERLVAVDPYVLVLDRRAGQSPLEQPGTTLSELSEWLGSLDNEERTPLLVAGENRQDFAAFTLYLAGELLDDASQQQLWGELRNTSLAARGERSPTEAMAGDVEALEALIEELSPVVAFLREWKEAGILVFNWTNWDRIAVEQAVREGRGALVFQRRSWLKTLAWEEAFHLRMRLPPVGSSKTLYSMVGRGVAVTPGEGVRSDAATGVRALLRRADVQEAVESDTSWSPVVQEGTPLNREHRDVVRWVAGAQEFVVLEGAVVEHPLFRRLHQILR